MNPAHEKYVSTQWDLCKPLFREHADFENIKAGTLEG